MEEHKINSAQGALTVGIIMDGNRRWARARGLSSMEGHTAGLAKAKDIVRHAFFSGVETVVLYAFSTENWSRTAQEVSYLMDLFSGALMRELDELSQESIRIRFIGDRARVPEKLQEAMRKSEQRSKAGVSGKTLVIALSYGGRADILAGVNMLLAAHATHADEKTLQDAMWSHDLADPDIVIRTGGEKRLSNFLTWQTAYSELFFSDSFWPDFSCEEFDAILKNFAARERRRGK